MVRAYIGSNCLSFQMICHVGFVLLHFALGVVHVVQEGDNVTLSCDSSAIEYPKWLGVSKSFSSIYLSAPGIPDSIREYSNRLSWDPVNNKSLIVHNVTKDDNGGYMCSVGGGRDERHLVHVIIRPAKPEISNTEILDDGTEVIRGTMEQLFKLTCTSTGGFPKPNLEWFRDNNQTQSLSSNETYEIDVDGNYIVEQTYTFTPTRLDDGALYLCQSSFDSLQQLYQTDEVKLFLNLRPAKPEISNTEILDDGTEVIRGTMEQLFKLTCTSTGGFPKPNLEWFRDNNQTQSLSSNETYEINVDGNYIVEQTYTFTPTRLDDGAFYLCQSSFDSIQQFYQTDEVKLFLNLRPAKPEISNTEILDDGTEVIRGTMEQQFKLTCTSTGGFPKPNLEWFRDNNQTQSLSSNETYEIDADGNYIVEQTYTFTPTRLDDGVLYLCQSSFYAPQQFHQTDEVKLFLNQSIQTEQTSNVASLLGVIGGVVAVIVCTIIVVCVVVRKRRYTDYTRRNTSLHRDNIQSPEPANPTSGIVLENSDYGNMSNDVELEPLHGELKELKENAD